MLRVSLEWEPVLRVSPQQAELSGAEVAEPQQLPSSV
jgi:hypothetical protein